MPETLTIQDELRDRFGAAIRGEGASRDSVPTLWVESADIKAVARFLKEEVEQPFELLYDVFAVDERVRNGRELDPMLGDYTMVYHLTSFDRNADVRLKVALHGEHPAVDSLCDVWQMANWYEREAWDLMGVRFNGHPNLRRILMPNTWQTHPLRKDHPARATECPPFQLPDEKQAREQAAMEFVPEEWGLKRGTKDFDYMFLNLGPHHPGTHGILRIILQLDGEEIVEAIPEIGYHHRGAEKMGERQTWHTYIPYTDRVDYLSGVMNNLAYLLSVEQLAGIQVPERAQVIRIMMSEFFRISNHLVWYGTFAQDLGAMSPTFFMFNDREKLFDVVEGITGGRMHPSWFRIGGVAHDLPIGWEKAVDDFLDYLPARLHDYDRAVMANGIFKARSMGVGAYTKKEAIEWGVTGPGLRACGYDWDLRKKRPYSMIDQFEFDVPLAERGDCYDRAVVRIEEMRQSMRIIKQCRDNMPEGPFKSDHALTTPPRKERTMHDIETLINHFLNVSWGPIVPAGESFFGIEGSKGMYGYHLISDGNTMSYRTRIRTPSFPHMQMLPVLSRGVRVSDLLAILGSMDYVLADVDR